MTDNDLHAEETALRRERIALQVEYDRLKGDPGDVAGQFAYVRQEHAHIGRQLAFLAARLARKP